MVFRIVAMALAPITLVFLVFGPLSSRGPRPPQGLVWTKPVKGAPVQVAAKLQELDLAEAIGPGVEVEVEKDGERVRWVVQADRRRALTFVADLNRYSARRTDLRALLDRGDAPRDALPDALRSDEAAFAMFTAALTEHLHGFSPPKLPDYGEEVRYTNRTSSYSSSGYAVAPKPGEPMLDPTPSRY